MRQIWEQAGYDIVPLIHAWLNTSFEIGSQMEDMYKHGSPQLTDKINPENVPTVTKEQVENLDKLFETRPNSQM